MSKHESKRYLRRAFTVAAKVTAVALASLAIPTMPAMATESQGTPAAHPKRGAAAPHAAIQKGPARAAKAPSTYTCSGGSCETQQRQAQRRGKWELSEFDASKSAKGPRANASAAAQYNPKELGIDRRKRP
jgi:hypothetical protein